MPVSLRPRPFPDLLGREEQVSAALESVSRSTPREFFGGQGFGKTALMRHLVHHPSIASVEAVIFLAGRTRPADDLLQAIFDALYVTEIPFKPTDTQLRYYLQDANALVFLDDLELSRVEVGTLMDAVPHCIFILASERQQLWGEGNSTPLRGLTQDAGVALLEREVGREFSGDECLAAQELCAALKGNPLQIIRAAALMREEKSAATLVLRAPAASLEDALTEDALQSLSESERRVLAVLTAAAGAPLRLRLISALTGSSDADKALHSLITRGLARSADGTFALSGGPNPSLQQALASEQWAGRILDYLAVWAEEQRDPSALRAEDIEAVLEMLRWASKTKRWRDILRLGRAVEGALIRNGRWGAWQEILSKQLEAAQVLKDPAAEGWSLHQIGTRALCLDDSSTARSALTQALQIREQLGDHPGAAVTRHNLQVLMGPPRPPHRDEPPRLSPMTSAPPLLIAGIFVVLGLLLFAVNQWWPTASEDSGTKLLSAGLSPTSLDFGRVMVGKITREPVKLTNRGSTPANVGRIALVPPLKDFRITNDCTSVTLGGGKVCTFDVIYRPSTTGPHTTQLVIGGEAFGNGRIVEVTGFGTPPPNAPAVGLDRTHLNFGEVVVGYRAKESVEVTNTGTDAMTLKSITRAPLIQEFHVADDCPGTLEPKRSCVISVTYSPTTTGRHTARVVIADTAIGNPHRV
ncbi:MAG: choice-of-anchor D domain-containing protein, partial [Actinomycetota bacterium]|nr:choice-of-anchor D domain-containing protein [Actinomycetota bacterium]